MIDNKEKNECCGCGSCEQICPVHAIHMEEDAEGFLYPKISVDLCIKCDLCDSVCPFSSDYVGKVAEPAVYAAINQSETICRKSSSGGVFSAVSDWILEQQGFVFGVKFDDDFHVIHTEAGSHTERNRFRGSKYVQSDTKQLYTLAEKRLKEGKKVLFTGTPCQVEALNKYLLIKKIDTERLYTIDNICHGVASPGVWEKYILTLKKYLLEGEQIRYISMRSKNCEWRKQEMDVMTNRRNISKYVNQKFSWNRLFRTLFVLRPSCYHCKFTSYKRCSDLTLADYWNYENAGLPLDDKNGVSLILVNSSKGEKVLEAVKEKLQLVPSTKKDCWQVHLEFPNNEPKNRKKFWHDYRELDTSTVLKKYAKGSFINKMIRFISPFLRKLGLYTFAAKVHHKLGGK